MRLDKYLKVSRVIKRRTLANEVADAGRVLVNGKPAKAAVEEEDGRVRFGGMIHIGRGDTPNARRAASMALTHSPHCRQKARAAGGESGKLGSAV